MRSLATKVNHNHRTVKSNWICTITMILISGFWLCSNALSGQPGSDTTGIESQDSSIASSAIPPHLIKCMVRDLGKIWTAPVSAKPKDLLVWGPAVGITGLLIAYDKEIYKAINDWESKSPFVQKVDPYITYIGDEKFVFGLFSAFYITGEIFQNDRAKQTAVLGLQTLFHTGLAAQVAKHVAGRQRPLMSGGTEDIWHGPKGAYLRYQVNQNIRTYNSFFSGHSIVTWGMATVIASQYKDIRVIPILSYGIATLVSLSRVTEQVHWPSDVFIGAFLGYQIGRYMVKHGCSRVRLLPRRSQHGTEVSFIYSF
jgi:hypothetical protein